MVGGIIAVIGVIIFIAMASRENTSKKVSERIEESHRYNRELEDSLCNARSTIAICNDLGIDPMEVKAVAKEMHPQYEDVRYPGIMIEGLGRYELIRRGFEPRNPTIGNGLCPGNLDPIPVIEEVIRRTEARKALEKHEVEEPKEQ